LILSFEGQKEACCTFRICFRTEHRNGKSTNGADIS